MDNDTQSPWEEGVATLPLDCEAQYFPNFLTPKESEEIFEFLLQNYDLSDRTITIADGTVYMMDTGKHIFADPELTSYSQLPEVLGKRSAWPPQLEMIKERLQTLLKRRFHVCLCIHYKSGAVGAGLHTDMPEFGPVSFLTVISLGTGREFLFKSKEDNQAEYRLTLEPGSLLTMGQGCQERYQHGLPEDPNCDQARISLSYRQFGWD